jgi:hypothetical protein
MTTQLRRRAKDELLIKLVGSAAEVSADQTGVLGLGLPRAAKRPREHHLRESGREPFQLGLDEVRDILVRAGIARRHVSMAVQGVLTFRRTGPVKLGVLTHDQRRPIGHHAPLTRISRRGQIPQLPTDVHNRRLSSFGSRPRRGPSRRVIELERRRRIPPDP